jgi:hypothetical protein
MDVEIRDFLGGDLKIALDGGQTLSASCESGARRQNPGCLP